MEGKRKEPTFKSGFAIDTLLSKNYIGNMIAIKTKFLKQYPEILKKLKQEDIAYDLLLRISEKTEEFVHIPRVLYHELLENKNIDTKAQKEIIAQYLERNEIPYQEIKDGMYKGNYKIEYEIMIIQKIYKN